MAIAIVLILRENRYAPASIILMVRRGDHGLERGPPDTWNLSLTRCALTIPGPVMCREAMLPASRRSASIITRDRALSAAVPLKAVGG